MDCICVSIPIAISHVASIIEASWFFSAAASEAIAEAISTGPAGTTAVANVIATTIADKGESTSLFAKSVGLLIAEKGCEVLKPALVGEFLYCTC